MIGPGVATLCLFIGCCSDVVFLELLVKDDPGSGNIITFMRFLFIALEGLIFTSNFFTRKSVVPVRKYIMLVLFVFITSVLNNVVLNFNISMPLHMIFRSGSLITSMILGIVLLKRRYSVAKYVSVLMITVGVATCTVESGKYIKKSNLVSDLETDNDIFIWSIGVALMTLSLFLSARMGIYQESLSLEFGKNPREALFYSHAMPLPGFLILGGDIYNHALIFNKSDPISVVGFDVPKMWLFLLANVITNYICSRSAFVLASECSSLTVTLAVTLRKFVSLMLSIVYFKNPFTTFHWLGALMVFIGTLIFTEMINMDALVPSYRKRSEKKHDEDEVVVNHKLTKAE